jgi:hypothetical protein
MIAKIENSILEGKLLLIEKFEDRNLPKVLD